MSEENDYEDYDYENEYDIEEDNNLGDNDLQDNAEYEFLKGDEFERKREEQIQEFMDYSSLTHDEAEIALISFQWNIEKLQTIWFDNAEQNKIRCGIELSPKAISKLFNNANNKECLVCYEELDNTNSISLSCHHFFCRDCYKEYILSKINDDPLTAIASLCPLKDCNLVIPSSVIFDLLKDEPEQLKKYKKYLMNNYTESNSDIKWCPNPNCGICVRVPGHGMKEIKCLCGMAFCFKCLRETHRPCDCEMVEKWEMKNKSNSENVKWLLLNTKQCPNCHKYIEKNQGCNHMTCRKEAGGCGYEFCWICLGPWEKHGTSYYKCKFEADIVKNKEEQKKLANTKYELEKYVKYFEQYMNHDKAQKFAEKLTDQVRAQKEEFSLKKNIPFIELQFLDEAVETIIDCRRMLKYSYVFGYYLYENSNLKLYEHNQYLLDQKTDKLHEMMEKDEIPNLLHQNNLKEFTRQYMNFRGNVVNHIGSMKTYKENLLNEIESKMVNQINYNLLNKVN